ncbi:cytochrome P450 [Delitschia confertaspora ATCC 74209]|uniref:Cytochrome P450 n=1 Tax=Delitschia confertaspora ATCC 74209 TaxID=1513339 RepID=A0A9P4JKX9_9PLEO|nr:cytochrome P450 [Delitschia confertaspora ATCC 74209]
MGLVSAAITLLVTFLLAGVFYRQYMHPLSKFPGPWWLTSTSLVLALISTTGKEPELLLYLIRRYGRDRPIRITPSMLMFTRASALKDIYWDAKCNQKGNSYGTGVLGPPHIFSTLEAERHKVLRKAISNAPWTIGQLKNTWESRFDGLIDIFLGKMNEHAAAGRTVCLSDKVAEFAADIMSMISFTEPFGSVRNQRDEKRVLTEWRKGLPFFGFASRFRFFREVIIKLPVIGAWFLPKASQESGFGWLMCEADRQVSAREKAISEKPFEGKPDFLQHAIDARFPDGTGLDASQRRAHVTLLIQAGADTTATAMGSLLRFILLDNRVFARVRQEIDIAEKNGHLSSPIQYEETRQHLPYFVACVKECLRLNPPAPNLFVRVTPQGGKTIDSYFIPGGTEITSHAYSLHRDRNLYGEDAEEFNPVRWLESESKSWEFEAAQITFGMGPRGCLGKDIAIMELYKLLPELIRRFDIELTTPGKYIVMGGVGYNVGFTGKLARRKAED